MRLRTRIHRKDHVIPKGICDLLRELGEDRVVEGARRERQSLRLLYERLDDARVAMALEACGEVSLSCHLWRKHGGLTWFTALDRRQNRSWDI